MVAVEDPVPSQLQQMHVKADLSCYIVGCVVTFYIVNVLKKIQFGELWGTLEGLLQTVFLYCLGILHARQTTPQTSNSTRFLGHHFLICSKSTLSTRRPIKQEMMQSIQAIFMLTHSYYPLPSFCIVHSHDSLPHLDAVK